MADIKLCGLCFIEICGNYYKVVTKEARLMLDMLIIKLHLDTAEYPVVCNDCHNNLSKCYNFKANCLALENGPLCSVQLKENCILNVEKIHREQEKRNELAKKERLCRFCIKVTEEPLYDLSEIKENIFLIDLIGTHMSEMNLKIIEGILTCESCLESLKNFYNFITNYLYVEKDLENSDMPVLDNKIWIKKVEDTPFLTPERVEIKREKNITDDVDTNAVINWNNVERPQNTQLSTTKFKCKRCYFSTEHKNSLFAHVLTHSKLCESGTSRSAEAYRETRFKLRTYRCHNCTFESQYKRSLVRHMVQHKAHWRCWPNFSNMT